MYAWTMRCQQLRSFETGDWRIGLWTYGVVWLDEWIVDSDDLDVVELDGIAEDDTSNTSETVDSDLGNSHFAGEVSISAGNGRMIMRFCEFLSLMNR
jgi:hypothetical protein